MLAEPTRSVRGQRQRGARRARSGRKAARRDVRGGATRAQAPASGRARAAAAKRGAARAHRAAAPRALSAPLGGRGRRNLPLRLFADFKVFFFFFIHIGSTATLVCREVVGQSERHACARSAGPRARRHGTGAVPHRPTWRCAHGPGAATGAARRSTQTLLSFCSHHPTHTQHEAVTGRPGCAHYFQCSRLLKNFAVAAASMCASIWYFLGLCGFPPAIYTRTPVRPPPRL